MNTDSNSPAPFCRFDDSSIMVGLSTLPSGEEVEFIEEMNLFHERYREGLYEKFPPGEKDPEYLKKFYNPRYYELFGRFDLAVINVIDDFEFPTQSFSPLSRRWPGDRDLEGREIADPNMDKAGKRSFLHQVIIGPTPLIRSDDKDKTLNLASDTFLSENPLPLIGICQLKLNNALLLGSGTDYLRATIKTIHKFYREYISEKQKNRQLKLIILESSSWHEICLLTFSDSFKTIFDYLFALREMDVGDMERLLSSDPKYRADYDLFCDSEKFVQLVNGNSPKISGNHLFANSLTLPGFRWDILHNNGSPQTTPLPISDDDKGCMIPVSRFIVKPGHCLETKDNLKRDEVDYCIGRGGDFLCLPVLSKDKSAEEDFKYIVESLSSRELVNFFNDYLRPVNSDDDKSESRANPHDLNKNCIASKSFIIATGMKDFSKPIDESHTYFEKDLKSLAISMDEINLKVIDPLRKYRVSKIAAMRLRNAISLFNEGIQDRLLFTNFLELKSYIHSIIEGLSNDLKYNSGLLLDFSSFKHLGILFGKFLENESKFDTYIARKISPDLLAKLEGELARDPKQDNKVIDEVIEQLNNILQGQLIYGDKEFESVKDCVSDDYRTTYSRYSHVSQNSLELNRKLFDLFYDDYLKKKANLHLHEISTRLNWYVDDFIIGWQNRFHLNWRMSETTDYNCEFKGGIQQIITAFDGAYKSVTKALTDKSDVIALATGLDTIRSTRRTVKLNYYDIFQPEFFAARVVHEIGELMLDDLEQEPSPSEGIIDVKKLINNGDKDNGDPDFSELESCHVTYKLEGLIGLLSSSLIDPNDLTGLFNKYLMSEIYSDYADFICTFFCDKALFIKWRRNLLLSNSMHCWYQYDISDTVLIPDAFIRYLSRVIFIVCDENDPIMEGKIPADHPLRHFCKFGDDRLKKRVEKTIIILHNTILTLIRKNVSGLGTWKYSAKTIILGRFTEIWKFDPDTINSEIPIPANVREKIASISKSLASGIVIPYNRTINEFESYKFVQLLMYSYLSHLDKLSGEDDEFRFDLHRNKEGIPKPKGNSANILFDTRSGTFIHKPDYRRAYLKTRFAFIYSLWDMNTKEKIKLIENSNFTC